MAGAIPSQQSDVYSIGSVLYEIFTGNPPFECDTVDEMLDHQNNSIPKLMRLSVSGFPDELDQVILKVLSKEPSMRYRSADQLGNVLTMIRNRLGIYPDATKPSKPPSLPIQSLVPPISYEDSPVSKDYSGSVDWSLIGIELLCLLMAGGLIPFWLFVIFSIRPLLR
jgi:serine/threonine protein kinase